MPALGVQDFRLIASRRSWMSATGFRKADAEPLTVETMIVALK
jgi:hypothetical protein